MKHDIIVVCPLLLRGLYSDAGSLYQQYNISQKTGSYANTVTEAERIAGGYAGAYALGTAGAEFGAGFGFAVGGPVGAAVFGLAGGLVGGAAGYWGGGYALPKTINDLTNLLDPTSAPPKPDPIE